MIIRVISEGTLHRWKCRCGASSNIWFKSEQEAFKRAEKHANKVHLKED